MFGIILSLPNIVVIKYEVNNTTMEQTCAEDWTYFASEHELQPIELQDFSYMPSDTLNVTYDDTFDSMSQFDTLMDMLTDELTVGM